MEPNIANPMTIRAWGRTVNVVSKAALRLEAGRLAGAANRAPPYGGRPGGELLQSGDGRWQYELGTTADRRHRKLRRP